MIGIPRTASVQQINISARVAGAVAQFPTTVADLVAQYADESCYAEQRFEVDSGYQVIDNETNQKIKTAIKTVLANEGDLARKRIIFENLVKVEARTCNDTDKTELPAVNYFRLVECHRTEVKAIFNEIRFDGQQINLDQVDFSGIALTSLDLTGASAVGARFDSTKMHSLVWKRGDFTGAIFKDTTVISCDLSDAVLLKSVWTKCKIEACWLCRANLEQINMVRVEFKLVMADQIMLEDGQFAPLIQGDIDTIGDLHCCPAYFQLEISSKFLLDRYYSEERVAFATVLLGVFSSTVLTLT